MSLTVISEPGVIAYSKNPIEWHLRSANYVTTQPVAGVYEMVFTTKLTTIGSALTLSWNGNSVTFFVDTTTDANGYLLPDDIPSTTVGQYCEALADTWFTAQYLLQKDFIIEYVATNTVRFTAREAGTELALTYTTDIPSGEAVFSTATTPVGLDVLDNYAVIMDVEVEETYGSGTFTRIGTLHATPTLYDDAGTLKGDAKLDVQELIDGFLQTREDAPNPASATAFAADNTNLMYRVVYAERYSINSSFVTVYRTQSDNKRVLKGGLNYQDVANVGDLDTNYFSAALKPFNTFQPFTKEVTANELHWIYWCTPHQLTGIDQYRTFFTVYYTDGTTDTSAPDLTTQDKYETYAYAVGFEQRSLDTLQPAKIPYKYTLQISIQGTATTDTVVQTFWLVDETRQDKQFLFENGVQGWDTLRCNGDAVNSAAFSKKEALNVLQDGYSATDRIIEVKSEGFTDTTKVFTGFKPKAEAAHLRAFLNSEKVYEVVNGVLVPVVVNASKSFELEHEKTGDYGYGLEFTYRHAFLNKGYSNA